MSRILLFSQDQGLVAAFRTKARGLDFTFTLQSDGEGDPRSERPAALVVDLRSQTEIPETALRAAECILLVICTDEDAGLAERAMRDHEAHVVFADSTERAALQGVFALRKALYEDDKHGTALEAARTATTRYEDLLQAIPDIVYRLDANGNFTFVNDAIHSLGYTPEELIGRHFSKILHGEEIRRVSRQYVLPNYRGKITGKDGAPGLFDERRGRERRTRGMEIRLKGGLRSGAPESMEGVAITYGEVSATGHYREEEREQVFTGTVGIIRDVSWRKRSEKLLHLISRALEQSNTGVCIFSPDGEIVYANPRYSRMLGVPHDQLLGAAMNEVWNRHCPDTGFEEIVRTTMEAGNAQEDLRCITANGSDLWVSARTQIVETGESLTYILLLQDDIGE